MRSGQGQYESPSAFIRSYNGDWLKDAMNGKGTMLFAGNVTYEGGVLDDLVNAPLLSDYFVATRRRNDGIRL